MTEFSFPRNPNGPQTQQPQQAPAPRRNTGLKVFLAITVLLLLVSLAGNFVLFVGLALVGGGGLDSPSTHVQPETLQRGSFDKIAIMPLNGVVDGNMVENAHRFSQYVLADNNIKAVIVEVDSPGGSVTSSDEIHHILSNLAQKRKLVVSMRGLAASGGYYISMPAEKIYAQPTTLTGSIGVIMTTMELTRMMDKIGVQPETVKSDNAETFKDAGSPFKKFTDEDRAYFKGIINNAHGKFSKIVEDGRKGKLTKDIKEIAIGKVWPAEDAKALGLVDEIAYMDEIITNTARDVGISNPTVIRLQRSMSFLDALTANGGIAPRNVEIKIDPATLDHLRQAATPAIEFRYDGPYLK